MMTPRRKQLVLRATSQPSDLSKALIPYQPSGKSLTARMRNLASNHTMTSLTQPEKMSCEFKAPKSTPSAIPPTVSFSNQSKYLFGILVTVTVLAALNSMVVFPSKCDSTALSVDLKALGNVLMHELYGQPVAVEVIMEHLEEFQVNVDQLAVYVLFGGIGTGKTWTTHLIRKSLPDRVNQVTIHLSPWSSLDDMVNHVRRGIRYCCRWNFLFIEDSDYSNLRQIEVLLEMLSEIGQHNGSCLYHPRKVVVMFTSGRGQKELAHLALRHFQQPEKKEKLTQEASQLLSSPLTDCMVRKNISFIPVPYFPLSKREVWRCIERDLIRKKKVQSVEAVDFVLKNLRFVPEEFEYFAASGCKPVSSQVNLL